MDGEEEKEERSLEVHSIARSTPALFQWPMSLHDDKDTANEVIETIRLICLDEQDTVPRLAEEVDRILRDTDAKSYQSMKQLCDKYNEIIDEILQQDPEVPLRLRRRPSVNLLRHIIQQCYNRAVVDPEKLNQYEPFSAGVYGETSFELIDQMINTISLTENDIFIDLGSGVGQVVLQVAAATECKSCIGIEKANWPAQYAEQMTYEFHRWMGFYGKTYSNFELIKGDFLSDEHRATINASTVIFVNNFAFGPEVDLQLKERFHDLKEGSKIVSSREFRPMNMQISERNLSDVGAILTVQELSPLRGPVSWTHKPVSYFLHTIDRTQLENFYFSRRNGIKLVDPPKKEVQRSKILRDGQNNKFITGRQRLARRKHIRYQRLPSHREQLKDARHSALKLLGTIEVPRETALMRDLETNGKNGMVVSQGLHFSKKEDLPVQRNGVYPRLQAGADMAIISKERLERHIQRLKLSSGVLFGDVNGQRLPVVGNEFSANVALERLRSGKRKHRSDDTPDPKRRKMFLAEASVTRTENSSALDSKFGASLAQNSRTSPSKSVGDVTELTDLQTLRSLLAVNGKRRERKESEMSRNVQEVRTRTRLLDRQIQRSFLPLSDINGNKREEQGICEASQMECPSYKTNNRWLFNIHLPTPPMNVDGLIDSEMEDPVPPSATRASDKIRQRSSSEKNGRIKVDSHPNHANRGFVRAKNRCRLRIQSSESGVTATSNNDGFNPCSGDKVSLKPDNRIQEYFNLGTAPERKSAKKFGDGLSGTHLSAGRALLGNLDESMWEPCWTDDEYEQEELNEALEELHKETDNVTKTGVSSSGQFNVEWMDQKARNICRRLPLPETEPISGSSDVTNPPEFFPPSNASVSSWLLSNLKRDGDSKPRDWNPVCAEQEVSCKTFFVSLPRVILQRKPDDTKADNPATVSSIPISLPREAASFGIRSQRAPNPQFGSVTPPVPDRHPSPKSRAVIPQSNDSCETTSWAETVPFFPVSLPKEALLTKEESEAVAYGTPPSDALEGRHSSFTGSTTSYDNSLEIESQLRPAKVEDGLECKHQASAVDDSEVPESLWTLLDTFKSLYMNFLKYQKSPSHQQDLITKIEAEKSRKSAAVSRENELNHEILQLEEENACLLQKRWTEFLKYEELCCNQLSRSMQLQDKQQECRLLPESSLRTVDSESPSFLDHSVIHSPQLLDVALLESNLSQSSVDKSVENCKDALPVEFSEVCDVMPKLNLSISCSSNDEIPAQEDDCQARSHSGSPEPDMPLLVPELEDQSPREQSPWETKSAEEVASSCCTMSIPVKLPLRKLIRTRKPSDPSLTALPKPEANSPPPPSEGFGQLPTAPFSPRCPSLENDRLNMYSPISQASSVENLDDHQDSNVRQMQSFSPISSPAASVRSTASERVCYPGEGNVCVLPQMEAPSLQSLGTTAYQWRSFEQWRLASSETVDSDVKFPWPVGQPSEPISSRPEALVANGEWSSVETSVAVCSKISAKPSIAQTEDIRMNFIHRESSEGSVFKMSSGCQQLPPMNFKHCTSSSLGNRTVKSSASLERKYIDGVRRPRRCERSHSAIAGPLEPPAFGYHNVDAAVFRRLSQNSPRHSAGDSARQMDSRSDSRDSGLGKESEIDYDRLPSLRNGHVNSGALDSGVSSPRSQSVNRSLRFSQRCPLTPLTSGEPFPWQLGLHAQVDNSFDKHSGETFGRKSFDKRSLDGEFPQLSDRPTSAVSMFHENIQPRPQSTFHRVGDHDSPNEHPLPTFRLSQNEMRDVRDNHNDLNGFLGSNSLGNYLQMNCRQTWASNPSAINPSAVVGRAALPQIPGISVSNGLHRTNAKRLGHEHFPNSKIFGAAPWQSHTGTPQGSYDQKARYLSSTDPQQTSCPSPNSRLGLEPGFTASYFNRPSSRGFTQNVPFESYHAHYFGDSPALQSISSKHRIKRQVKNHQGFDYCQNGFTDHTLVRGAAEGLFFGPLGQR